VKRVYIVDDDEDLVESISMILQSKDYEVAAQYDDKDVVANVVAFGADLVILDVMFPEDSGAGFDVARALKSDERTSKLPILMLSAVNEAGIYVGSFSNRDRDETWLPVQEFVEKPIEPTALLAKVERLCPQ
jgi:two-component system alkaline phosphatase synthesis response regulator PhoP